MSHQMLSFIDERRRRRRRRTTLSRTTTTTTTKGERERAWEEVPAERASKRERESLEREKERERFFNGESRLLCYQNKRGQNTRDKMPKHQTERQTPDMTENRIKEEEKEGFQ